MGAVPKKLEPDSIRPVSDHTKTGFNRAVDLRAVEHTLDTYNEISRELRKGYYMRVEDVDGAFPILPLAPRVWKYMFVHWFDGRSRKTSNESRYIVTTLREPYLPTFLRDTG